MSVRVSGEKAMEQGYKRKMTFERKTDLVRNF